MTTPTRVCCPVCKGKCCIDKYDAPTEHPLDDFYMGVYYHHACPHCDDGTARAAPTCATCRFYRDGWCYRYPPSPERGRPLVASADFCGEWGE